MGAEAGKIFVLTDFLVLDEFAMVIEYHWGAASNRETNGHASIVAGQN
jgi:hypothetical protein